MVSERVPKLDDGAAELRNQDDTSREPTSQRQSKQTTSVAKLKPASEEPINLLEVEAMFDDVIESIKEHIKDTPICKFICKRV